MDNVYSGPVSNLASFDELPEYHSGLLMVKVRQADPRSIPTFASVMSAPAAAPGLAMLAAFERAGMIKRVTNVARPSDDQGAPRPAMATFAMSAMAEETPAQPTAGSVLRGLNLVEVERDQDCDNLRLALAQDPNVETVERVPIRYLLAKSGKGAARAGADDSAPAVPALAAPQISLMWNLPQIRHAAARAHPSFREPTAIQVAVLDSGVDFAHPDLNGPGANRVVKNYSFAHPDLPGVSGTQDIIGHGTHVTGTIAARLNNNLGIDGICDCFVRHWKIFQDSETFIPPQQGGPLFAFTVNPVMYHRALARCIELRVNVINLSIGGGGFSNVEQSLFTQLIANGTTIVAAMGNDRGRGSPTSFPAAYPGVIAVGATRGPDDFVANFSNAGNHITLCAPGVSIWSTLPTYPGRQPSRRAVVQGGQFVPAPAQPRTGGTDYANWDGTSMAAPHVTAAVAMLLASKGAMSPGAVRDALRRTVDRVPGMFGQPFTPDYGFGRLNLLRLLSET